ncbi:(2Fe-2S)-binding protein [Myxococcus xanthus]|nr:hypothetical protein [Myxococcus xanthus]
MGFTLNVNGREHAGDAPEDTPLLSILRDELGFTGPGMAAAWGSAAHVRC